MSADAALTPEQTRALFDILSHHETYAEIEAFKYPDAVTHYGYPFQNVTRVPLGSSRSPGSTPFATAPNTPRSRSPMPPEDGGKDKKPDVGGDGKGGDEGTDDDEMPPHSSSSPVLQTLLTRFVLPLPWLRDLPRDFWSVRIQGILGRLAEADLSESYDKGALGLRKTLATGSSALIEMLGRGALGGVRRDKDAKPRDAYDHKKAEELEEAWDDAVQELVYGDLVPGMFAHMVKTDDLESYSPCAKACVEYTLIHVATFLHHVFVVSAEGQYLLQLLSNVHNLIPYKLIKQTLRIGNAATMINGMVRLMLAKMSVGGITNWIGLTTNADDGMNLLQRIISMVLSWDAAEFRKSADRVEKDKSDDKPDDEVLQAIRHFIDDENRLEHDSTRDMSLKQSQSIIASILNKADPELAASLSEEQHTQCLEYYSALLSIHDRDAISGALTRQQPDLFTSLVRDMVNSYEPFIRMVHQGVDIREYLEATQVFIDDFIKASKPKKAASGEMRPPSVEDYVELCMNNRGLMYRWVHAVAKACPEVWDELEKWMTKAVTRFQPGDQSKEEGEKETSDTKTGAPQDEGEKKGSDKEEAEFQPQGKPMDRRLNVLIQSLPEASRGSVIQALDAHAIYLDKLTTQSRSHLQHILDSTANPDSPSDSQDGPGVYLSRWQSLLDETPITPELPVGPTRHGKDVKHALEMGKTSIVGSKTEGVVVNAAKKQDETPPAPDVSVVVKELSDGFVKILQDLGGPDE